MVAPAQLPPEIVVSERQAIQELVSRLREAYPREIVAVILFGSKARGDFECYSDTDILVLVENETWPLRSAIWDLAAAVELDFDDVVFNVQVIGIVRWRRMSEERFSLCCNVERDGILLFQRPGSEWSLL
ncbi:MAG: nucleotidyltransferase domain-containing protein [Anaerolineae bacterium]|nr:MAG: nucleotidyltransferase domain-containing protein [Anaerolineae bacterium]